jgi:hypothetical protein
MVLEMLFCFAILFTKIFQLILGYSLSAKRRILGTITPNDVALKSIQNYLCRSCPAFVPKLLVKLPQKCTGSLNTDTNVPPYKMPKTSILDIQCFV